MVRSTVKRILHPVRLLAGRFVILPEVEERNFAGRHSCIRTGAAFITWNQVEGDYLEFGVWHGRSFAAAYRSIMWHRRMHYRLAEDANLPASFDPTPEYNRWKQNSPRFFAFDSFEGLPKEEGEDQHMDFAPGSYRCSEEQFKANLAKAGIDLRDVVVIPGFYDRSLTREVKAGYALRKAAMVHIDCDLYESTLYVLDFITDLVGQGTIIIFDDWFRYRGSPKRGEQRACREWLECNPHLELVQHWREGPQAMSFLVNLK
jgi:O-methyltransferase